ncbi:polyprotein [Phytophthora megakarya]|uniref:Polyprotein n=1 Tax=Phytophthora megakarya TaxID=4795 RepID=A0A225X254_9STRA|nr:polyprotein [Phytophthora megakarya]
MVTHRLLPWMTLHALFGAEVAAITDDLVCFQETQLALSLRSSQFLENPRARRLPDLQWKHFLRGLKKGDIEQVCMLVHEYTAGATGVEFDADGPAFDTWTRSKGAEPKRAREARYAAQSLPTLESSGNPVAPLAREYIDIFPDKVPAVLLFIHEIDLVPGAKYCVTRQWPLPRDQVETIDAFFESRRQAGQVRESLSPLQSDLLCEEDHRRIAHVFNKLIDVTIPAQTSIPRKDMVLDTMSGSTKYNAIDLMVGFCQIVMREEDVPLTAISTPSAMLWEWGLRTPRPLSTEWCQISYIHTESYFDDIFTNSRAEDCMTDVEVHLDHLRQVFTVIRENKLYTNLKKCIFCAPETPVLGSYVSKNGVRADPEKIEAICAWTPPKDQKQLCQWIGPPPLLEELCGAAATIVAVAEGRRHVVMAF